MLENIQCDIGHRIHTIQRDSKYDRNMPKGGTLGFTLTVNGVHRNPYKSNCP